MNEIEILKERKICALCADSSDETCFNCKKVKGSTAKELNAAFDLAIQAIKEKQEVEKAISYFDRALEGSIRLNENGDTQNMYDEQIKMVKMAVQVLKEKHERDNMQCGNCAHWYKNHCSNGMFATEETKATDFCSCFEPKQQATSNRQIIFRAKRIDNSEWAKGGYWENNTGTRVSCKIIDDDGDGHTVAPRTVCQYIGLIDKNGIKMFEGDIVNVIYDSGENENVLIEDIRNLPKMVGSSIDGKEVIGNIYDKSSEEFNCWSKNK